MGYKIKINAMVFRFGLMGFWGNGTIRGRVGLRSGRFVGYVYKDLQTQLNGLLVVLC